METQTTTLNAIKSNIHNTFSKDVGCDSRSKIPLISCQIVLEKSPD